MLTLIGWLTVGGFFVGYGGSWLFHRWRAHEEAKATFRDLVSEQAQESKPWPHKGPHGGDWQKVRRG